MIVEPSTAGHRMIYVRRLVKEALALGIKPIIVTSKESLTHPAYLAIKTDLNSSPETLIFSPSRLSSRLIAASSLLIKQLGTYIMYAEFFRKLSRPDKPTAVFAPYLDHIDKIVSLFGSPFGTIPWGGLAMQFKFHYTAAGAEREPESGDKAKEQMFVKLLQTKHLKAIFTIDELLYEYTELRYPNLASRLHYVADPVEMHGVSAKSEARAHFGISSDQIIILCFGALTFRKGVKELVESTVSTEVDKSVAVFLAGSQNAEIKSYLAGDSAAQLRSAGRLYELNRFLDDHEEYEVFVASDIVWVGYKQFYGMSGVLIQAGKMGLPVISCRQGLVGWMVRKYNLGLCATLTDHAETAHIIRTLNSVSAREEHAKNGQQLAASHTSENFCNGIFRALLDPR